MPLTMHMDCAMNCFCLSSVVFSVWHYERVRQNHHPGTLIGGASLQVTQQETSVPPGSYPVYLHLNPSMAFINRLGIGKFPSPFCLKLAYESSTIAPIQLRSLLVKTLYSYSKKQSLLDGRKQHKPVTTNNERAEHLAFDLSQAGAILHLVSSTHDRLQ